MAREIQVANNTTDQLATDQIGGSQGGVVNLVREARDATFGDPEKSKPARGVRARRDDTAMVKRNPAAGCNDDGTFPI